MPEHQAVFHTLIEKNYAFGGVVSVKEKKDKQKGSALTSLILHRKICNHPIFVVNAQNLDKEPQYKNAMKAITEAYEHSGKLLGLVDLLS